MLKFLSAAALIAASGASVAQAQTIPNNVTFRNYFGTMAFNRPLLFTQYPGEDSVHIVLQQNGRIVTVQREGGDWAKTDSAVITVNGGTSGGNEQGLLGFAFHPQFRENRKYYVHYMGGSGNGFHMVAERTADTTLRPKSADAQSTIFRMNDFAGNHNGGSIGFGADGKLYIAIGDGGNANDTPNLAQNLDTLFGKILRIDVDGADAYPANTERNYAIPSDNPFVGQANRRPEIWVYGLRNPYRWSFHPTSGHMWIGDVGQGSWEEISRVDSAGSNLGWRIREGAYCFNPSTGCTSTGLLPPAKTMQRSHAASITGGDFFLGDSSSAFYGIYIFGDYVTNHVWAMRPSGATLTDSVRLGSVTNVVSFDRDSRGRVFATSLGTGSVNNNTGVVYVLESPDMIPGVPTALRAPARRAVMPALRAADVLRNPGDYVIRDLHGRLVEGFFARGDAAGVFFVEKRGTTSGPQRMTLAP